MRFIDLRSDTVTMPTESMREAMYHAEVGDDVYGDDPTLAELERHAADLVGKEAALFVPSGTFGNQLALLTHTKRGDEVILGHDCHIMIHEVGGLAVIAGVQARTIKTQNGTMDLKELESLIRGDNIHYPDTGLIAIENAHSSGAVVAIDHMKAIYEIAVKNGIPIHLDGARLFNAAIHLGVDSKEILKYTDSCMFCLSKGLCAPVGSMLVGDQSFIERAKKNRKLMGGGLRQGGFLAAAGIIALKDMVSRLKEDHEHAQYFAEKLSTYDFIKVKKDRNDINMIFFELSEEILSEAQFVDTFYKNNIKMNGMEDGEYRFVTNKDVTKEDIDFCLLIFDQLVSK